MADMDRYPDNWSPVVTAWSPVVTGVPLDDKVKAVLDKAFLLWQDRQKKYGSTNITSTGAVGCYVRSCDKLARLRGVYLEGKGDTPDESISDTWLDLINYAVMGYMCHKHEWPGT